MKGKRLQPYTSLIDMQKVAKEAIQWNVYIATL